MLAEYFSYEAIAILMFATMLVMLLTGQRVFGAIGFVAAAAALLLCAALQLSLALHQHSDRA